MPVPDEWRLNNDVMLVHLADPIEGAPLAELNSGAVPMNGEECTAVGFGQTVESDDTTRGTKKSVSYFVSPTDDTGLYATSFDGRIAGGDSGGPLICNNQVVAVAWSRRSANGQVPARYSQSTIAAVEQPQEDDF